jgi:hypothetical protein
LKEVIMQKSALFSAVLLGASFFASAQTSPNQDVFTINLVSVASPQEVQVRYFLSGDPAVQQAGSVARPTGNQIVIETAVAGKSAKGFRAIVFAPGCQLAAITANLASTRQADFQCQKLSATTLHGKADVSRFSGKALQVEALYNVRWAGKFFGVSRLSISPVSLGKAKVENDGSFAIDLPDFAADPLWNTFSSNASVAFVLVDPSNGERLAQLVPPRDLALGSSLKVAGTYPAEIEFTVK